MNFAFSDEQDELRAACAGSCGEVAESECAA